MISKSQSESYHIRVRRPAENIILLHLSGSWKTVNKLPEAREVLEAHLTPEIDVVEFDTSLLTEWDSGLLIFLFKLFALCSKRKIQVNQQGLPQGAQRLIALAQAVPRKKDGRKALSRENFLEKIGEKALGITHSLVKQLEFIGELFMAFLALLRGRARFRHSELMYFLQDSGPQALPIVTLISGLIGLILAFVGAIQLEMFGAEIYVADLVGIGMAREMGAMMTGIIMAGRTGASFAAQLGTMQVNEEVDALETFGFSPMEFLVLPRMLALSIMMPLLCIYSDVVGMLGGLIVTTTILDIPPIQYFSETVTAVHLNDITLGIVKSFVFGVIIALSGCMKGMECGRSATAVGQSTTSAVVTAIVAIIVTDGLFAVVTNILGI